MASGTLTEVLRETLAVFEGSGRPWTTPEVADHLGIGRRTAYARLERLAEQGRLETKKVGANSRVWWEPSLEPTATTDGADHPFERALPQLPGFLYRHDGGPDSRLTVVRGTAEGVSGYDLSAFEEGDVRWTGDVVHPDDRARRRDTLRTALADGDEFSIEYRIRTAGGRLRRVRELGWTVTEDGSDADVVEGIVTDITERREFGDSDEKRDQQFRSLVEATEEYAIFLLDSDGYVQTWNPGARRIKGYDAGEIIGERFSTFYTEDDCAAGLPEENLAAARENGTAEDEGWRVRKDGSRFWARVTITALRDDEGTLTGYAKVTRDMTERRERERELRRERNLLERILEIAPVRLGIFTPDGTAERLNSLSRKYLGVDESELERLSIEDLDLQDPDGTPISPADFPVSRVAESGETVSDWLVQHESPDDGRRWVSLTAAPLFGDDGTVERVVVAGNDLTELKRTERQLERQRDELKAELDDVFSRIDDAFFALDENLQFVHVNEQAENIFGHSAGELLGEHVLTVIDPGERAATLLEAALETQESVSFEETYGPLDAWFETHVYPSEGGLSVYVRDVTERKERERELERRICQQEVIADLGQRALENSDLDALMAEAADLVAETLGNDYCKVLDLDEDGDELLLRQGVGWQEGMVGSATVSAVENDSQAAYTLSTEQPVIVDDLDDDPRFSGPDLLTTHDVRSGLSAIIGSRDDPWGVLGTHDTAPKEFSEQDAAFVQSVANILATVIDHHKDQQELVHRREQLEALNSLNTVIHEITDAVLDQSTREEIETTVCDHLAASDSYLFAWIGDADATSQTVTLRTEAGVEGFLDDITISVDPDDALSQGPTGLAFRTGEMQTSYNFDSDSQFDPWREHVEQYGFKSSAAVPVVHDGTVYGVLNVYADRPRAFNGQEGDIMEQLGEIVGHAIAAVERKHALMSDEVVELQFQVEDVFESLGIAADTDEPISLDHTVPIGDGEFIFFGHTTPAGVETVERMVEQVPFCEDVTFRDGDDEVSFELKVSRPPVLSVIASLGGSVEEAIISNGNYRLTVYLPPSADVGRLLDAVTETYPDATVLKRRQVTTQDRSLDRGVQTLTSDLTPRQRTALDTAYHAGFYEWPREVSGEELAESLGVAPPTFHQHLRKAERKVFDELFSKPLQPPA